MHTLARRCACLLLLAAGGCMDIRAFEGDWSGPVVQEPAVRQGFAADARVVRLRLADVDLSGVSATLTTSDGKFYETALQPVTRFTNDVLSSLTFDGDPVRSYLHSAALATDPSCPCPAMVLISLYGDDHVELRVMRGDDLFGLFRLRRE